MAHFLVGAFHFLRARAMQAPLTFVGVSAAVTYYGVYDISYMLASTVAFHSPTKTPALCKYSGHAGGLAVGAAVLSLRFPRSAIVKAVSSGQIMSAPWMEATVTVGTSAAASGAVSAVAQRVCTSRRSAHVHEARS